MSQALQGSRAKGLRGQGARTHEMAHWPHCLGGLRSMHSAGEKRLFVSVAGLAGLAGREGRARARGAPSPTLASLRHELKIEKMSGVAWPEGSATRATATTTRAVRCNRVILSTQKVPCCAIVCAMGLWVP